MQILLLGNKIEAGNNASRVAKLGKHARAKGVSGNMFPRFARPLIEHYVHARAHVR